MEGRRSVGSTTLHIFSLPVEVLQHIFHQAIFYLFDEDPIRYSRSLDSSRCALSSVCSWWRNIVINYHILWASISYVNNDGSPTSLNWIRLCLLRSGRHDLHLAIRFTSDDLPHFPVSLSVRNRNSTTGHLMSFLDTMEDDMERVSRFSVQVISPQYLQLLIIPHLRIPQLKRLLVVIKGTPMEDIGGLVLNGVEQLEIRATTMRRTTLASLLAQCPSLRHLSLQTQYSSRHCHFGQSAQPALHATHLRSLRMHGCVLPARAFDAPELKRLVSFPHESMGRGNFWWETNHFRVGTIDHHEEVAPEHFPTLHQLAVGTWFCEMDYLEPSIRLIRAHPDISELSLHGDVGAHNLLTSAFQRPLHVYSTVHLSAGIEVKPGTGATSEDGGEGGMKVPTALRSVVIHSERAGTSAGKLADTLRHMMLASDVLQVRILIQPHGEAGGVDYGFRDYPDYMSLLTGFPGRFSFDTLPLIHVGSPYGECVECS
jgi:hypothetical protein